MNQHVQIGVGLKWGSFVCDCVSIDPSGCVQVVGWSTDRAALGSPPDLSIFDVRVPLNNAFRISRPDVMEATGSDNLLLGVVFEYLFDTEAHPGKGPTRVLLRHGGRTVFEADTVVHFMRPHYANLLNEGRVLGREQIYGSGPPSPLVSPGVLDIVNEHRDGPVLDFGCGSGALIQALRQREIEAYGLEMNSEIIQSHLLAEVRSFITLYDGRFPCPLESRGFETVYCFEVLEHISRFQEALAEMRRLARKRVILSVPNISAIPVCFRHQVIPWHFLEATHLNFFTPASLEKELRKYFEHVEHARIGQVRVNDGTYYTSLVTVCH